MKIDYRLSIACVSILALGCPADDSGDDAADTSSTGTTMSMGDDDDDDDDTTGDTTGDDDDDDSSSSGGGMGASVSGSITRSVMPAIGQDAIGDVYLGLLMECDQMADSVASTVVMGADLSGQGASVAYTIENVPDGTWHLAGFMDDNGTADPDDPDADMGDLAFADGFDIGCVEVTVADGMDEMGVDIDFNIAVPF